MASNFNVTILKKNINLSKKELSAIQQLAIDKAQAQVQSILSDSEFVKVSSVENMNNKEAKQKTVKIDVENLTKKLEEDNIKLSELNKLKSVFYLTEDYDTEEELYRNKIANKNDIVKMIILIRRHELAQTLSNKNLKKQVASQVKESLDEINSDDIMCVKEEIEEQDVDPMLNEVAKYAQQSEEAFENLSKKSKELKAIQEFVENSERKQYDKYKAQINQMDVDEENQNKINDQNDLPDFLNGNRNNEDDEKNDKKEVKALYSKAQVNKKLRERRVFNKNLDKINVQKFLENRLNLTNQMTNRLVYVNNNSNANEANNIVNLLNSKKKATDSDVWQYLQENLNNFKDIISPIKEVVKYELTQCKGKTLQATDISYVNLINVVAALVNKFDDVIKAINLHWQYTLNEQKREDFNNKLGEKAFRYNNEAINKLRNLSGYKSNEKFIEEKEWKNKSLIEKLNLRFKFTDRNQLPSIYTLKKLKDDEIVSFLVKRLNFRYERMKELIKDYNSNKDQPDLVAWKINNFVYYTNRDPRGRLFEFSSEIRDKTLASLDKHKKEYLQNYDKLLAILTEASDNNAVIGGIVCRGRYIRCYGKDFSYYINEHNYPIKRYKHKGRIYYRFVKNPNYKNGKVFYPSTKNNLLGNKRPGPDTASNVSNFKSNNRKNNYKQKNYNNFNNNTNNKDNSLSNSSNKKAFFSYNAIPKKKDKKEPKVKNFQN